jgi:general secretion pathway protein G
MEGALMRTFEIGCGGGRRPDRRQGRAYGGFSLLELTLVVAMISFPGILGRTKIRATHASLNTIKTAINSYYGFHSVYPPNLAALQAGANPFLEPGQSLLDGWKQPFLYQTPGLTPNHPYELVSKGPDGKYNTPDDISAWNAPAE